VIHEQTVLYRHIYQRILEPRSAVTAHAIGLAVERENAAQVLVTTTKQKVKYQYEVFHIDLLSVCHILIHLRKAANHLLVAHLENANGVPLQAIPKPLTLFVIGDPRSVVG
jgi:hypothetical protein